MFGDTCINVDNVRLTSDEIREVNIYGHFGLSVFQLLIRKRFGSDTVAPQVHFLELLFSMSASEQLSKFNLTGLMYELDGVYAGDVGEYAGEVGTYGGLGLYTGYYVTLLPK